MHSLLTEQIEAARGADGSVDLHRLASLVSETYESGLDRSDVHSELAAKIEDRTAQLHDSRRTLKLQNRRMVVALDSTGYAISIFDNTRRLVYANSYFTELYHLPRRLRRPGTPFAEIVRGRIDANSYVGDDAEAYYRERIEGVDRNQVWVDLHRLNTGETVSVNHQPLGDGGWVSTHKDVTEFTRLQEELAHRAYHDALTGLPNRHMLQERLAECVAESAGLGSFALLLVDLDGFKSINDTLGHAAGDALLREVGRRIEVATGEGGMAARMGGDEFAVVMDVGAVSRDAHGLAARLVEMGRTPVLLDGQPASIGFSVGVAVAPGDGGSPEKLLKSADLALYAAKAERRGSYRFFEPAMDKALRDRRQLERDLGVALEHGQFELHYQPILNLKTQGFSGFEALLRWTHPELGPISPAAFIPVAEDTGLIVGIGDWVLRQAIAEAAGWPGGLRVAVNVSSVQFQRGNVVATILNALGSSGLAPERLEIEITESVFFDNSTANLDALRQLHALGCKIALDDFGTGYSALSYLLSYPFDKIKIDGSFVRALDNASGAHAIVRAIAEIGHRMGMTTTAEGVETAEQLRNVHAVGYSEAQGFLIARPMPADQLQIMLAGEDDRMPLAPMHRAAG
ncbi:MAG: EAL domain-containing protein [Devosia sp.]